MTKKIFNFPGVLNIYNYIFISLLKTTFKNLKAYNYIKPPGMNVKREN